MGYKIFTLSPGSTSTKLAVFDGEERIFKANVQHDTEVLKTFKRVSEQLPYRVETIMKELEANRIDIHDMDAFAAYSGGLESTTTGIFPVNDKILEDCSSGRLMEHPAILGSQIIHAFAEETGKPCRSPHIAKVGKTARYLRLSVLDGDPGLWEFKVFN